MSKNFLPEFPESPEDFDDNKAGIPKNHLIALLKSYRMEPGINTALFIAAGALGRKKTWTDSDYGEHWVRVSGLGVRHSGIPVEEIITGILHDVLEDSDWAVDDLRDVGFSELICNAVESVTKKEPGPGGEKEKYLDASRRASIDPIGRHVKMRDNDDNMDLTRGPFAAGNKQKYLYHISYKYLEAVDQGKVTPGSSIWNFLRDRRYANLINEENAHIIADATNDPMPSDLQLKFNRLAGSGLVAPDLENH